MASDYAFTEQECQAVKEFLNHFVFIKSVRDTFSVLYETAPNAYVLLHTAEEFFQYLHRLLTYFLYLSYAKLTDPSDSNNRNLSVEYIYKMRSWREPDASKLSGLYQRINSFRPYVTAPRNKIIAHNDLRTYLNQANSSGGFPKGKDSEFMQDIEAFLNIVHELAFGEIFGSITTSNPGDAVDLVRILGQGAAADRILKRWGDRHVTHAIVEEMELIHKEAEGYKLEE